MDDVLLKILKDCPVKSKVIESVKETAFYVELTDSLKKYYNEQSNERQKISTLYQQVLKDKFNIESEMKVQNEKLLKSEEENGNLNIKVEELEKLKEKFENDTIKDKKIESLEKEIETLKGSKNLLLGEKTELLGILNRKDIHIQQLDEQWKENVEKLRKANSLKCELQAKLDEYTQNGTLNEWRKKLATQQTEIFENQIKQHFETISSQSNEIIRLKREINELTLKLETLKDEKTSESNHMKETIKNTKKLYDNLHEKYEQLIEKATNNESLMNMEKLELEKEVKSTNRLNELLTEEKVEYEEALKKHQEIQNELMSKLVDQENENSRLVENFNENSRIWAENVSTYDTKVKNLEEELIVAQTILENNNSQCQLDVSLDLNNSLIYKDKNLSLQNSINFGNTSQLTPLAHSTSQLLKKGVSITQIYADYNRSLETIKELKNEISRLLSQSNALSVEMTQKNDLMNQLKDEKSRSDLYSDHLSKNLLEANNELLNVQEKLDQIKKENVVLLEEKISLSQLNDNLSTQIKAFLLQNIQEDTFNDELVFQTVEQLQNQNMKLLTIINNLKTKVEQLSCDPKTEEVYETRLKEANDEINVLDENLTKIKVKYDTCQKQLDIFMSRNVDVDLKIKNDVELNENKNSMNFENVRKQCQDLLNTKIEQLSELRLEMGRLDELNTHLKSQICNLESQLVVFQEQKQSMLLKIENDQKEYLLKEEKIIQLDLLNKQQKENIMFYKNNCDELSDKLNKIDEAYRTLSSENVHLRETCKFLETKMETQDNQNNNFGQLLTYIQDIQNTLQYKENSTQIKVSSYVDELKEEIKRLRFQLKDSQDNKNDKYQVEMYKLKEELTEKLKDKDNLIYKLNNNLQNNNIENNNIENNNFDNSNLIKQIETYKKQIDQYMAISLAAEENLEKNVNAWNECKLKLENDICNFENIIKEKNLKIDEINTQIIKLDSTIEEKNGHIKQLENEQNKKIDPIKKELEIMKEKEIEWNNSKDNLNLLLKQLREKYEIELIGHADDITSLKEIGKKYEEIEKKGLKLENEIRSYKMKLESQQNEYNAKIEEYELTIGEKNHIEKSVMDQNQILINQMDELMKQILIFKENSLTSTSTSTDLKSNGNNYEELWELIKFLRRDKEVLQVRLDSYKSEASKYRIKCERLEQGCQNLEASLIAERSILNESNCMVEQNMKLQQVEYTNTQLEAKVNQLEKDIVEMEEKIEISKCKVKEYEKLSTEKDITIEKANSEIENLKEQLLYLNKCCDDLKKNNEILKSQVEMIKNKMTNQVNKYNTEITNLKNQLSSNADQTNIINQKNDLIENYQNEIQTLKNNLNNVENELKTSIKRNQSLHSIATHLKKEISNTKSNSGDSNLQQELAQSKTKNSLMENEVKKLRAQINPEQNVHLLDKYNKLSQEFVTLKHKYELNAKKLNEMKNFKFEANVSDSHTSMSIPIHERITDLPNLKKNNFMRISPPKLFANNELQNSIQIKKELSKLSISPQHNDSKSFEQINNVSTLPQPISIDDEKQSINNNISSESLINTIKESDNNESLNLKKNRSLVRRKTPIIGSQLKSQTLSSTSTPKIKIDHNNSNELIQSDLIQFSATQSQLFPNDDKSINSDDSIFKKPQKRSNSNILQNASVLQVDINPKKLLIQNSNNECTLNNVDNEITNNSQNVILNETTIKPATNDIVNDIKSTFKPLSIFETPEKQLFYY